MRRKVSISTRAAAALFIDLQEEHRCDERYLVEGFDAVLCNIRSLQAAARRAGVAVLHSAYVVDSSVLARRPFHPMSTDGRSAFSDAASPFCAICPEAGPIGAEDVLIKSEASAFGSGDLTRKLEALGTEWVFIAGVWTEACVSATVRDAIDLGLRVMLVKDACGSGSIAMHQTGVLNLANRLYGGAVTSTEDACRIMSGATVAVWVVEGAVPLRFTYENAEQLYEAL